MREYEERLVDTYLTFLKEIPNSIQYWADLNKDLSAVMRQLGRPNAFLTMSANETRWYGLLRILQLT